MKTQHEDENMTEYSHDTEHELNGEGNSGNDKDSGDDDINNNPGAGNGR